MPSAQEFKLFIIQPTVPHYRKEFFGLLADVVGASVILRAAPSIPGGPASIPMGALQKVDYRTDCSFRSWLSGRAYWQRGLSLDGLATGDVLVLSGNPRFLSNFPLLWQAHRRGAGVVWWGHGWSSTSRIFTAWVRRGLMRLADVLLLYTDAEREQFIKRGFASPRVFATNNSIGSAEINEAKNYWLAPRLERFQEEQSIKDREILLFCGRLTLKSEFLLLLEAFSEVAKLHPAVTLAVVGDGELRPSAQGRSRALGISDRVIWLGEVHEERQLAPWFLSAKALIYPGSIGLSLLHAFNYGLPVITHATIRRHNPEISALEHGVNGLMFADGNVGALVASIEELLNDPRRRERMSEAALQTVEGRYSTERMVSGFVDAVHAARRSALARVGAVDA